MRGQETRPREDRRIARLARSANYHATPGRIGKELHRWPTVTAPGIRSQAEIPAQHERIDSAVLLDARRPVQQRLGSSRCVGPPQRWKRPRVENVTVERARVTQQRLLRCVRQAPGSSGKLVRGVKGFTEPCQEGAAHIRPIPGLQPGKMAHPGVREDRQLPLC
jgi:hypothetical protein